MESLALVLVLLQAGVPRTVNVIPGYSKDGCDRAVYLITSSPPPAQPPQKEIIRQIAWCIPGPGK